MAEDNERRPEEKKPWDVFISSTDEVKYKNKNKIIFINHFHFQASSASETTTEQWQQAYRILKVLTIIICFAVVLTAGIVTKGINIQPDTEVLKSEPLCLESWNQVFLNSNKIWETQKLRNANMIICFRSNILYSKSDIWRTPRIL